MKKYTIEDIKIFKKNEDGYTLYPTGDYTAIKDFYHRCIFAENCVFGNYCAFGAWCMFGDNCIFGDCCHFGEGCSFGELCNFGEWCDFGKNCEYGENCNFENERIKNGMYFACTRIGGRGLTAYFFCDENNKMFVREGDFFGDEEFFLEQLECSYSGTKYERQYILAFELAKKVLLKEI